MYQYFGAPELGAFITVFAVLSAIALTVLVRKHRPAFWWSLTGTLCLAIAFPLIYFLRIEPINVVIKANAGAVPLNWEQLRSQWEYAHATNFVFGLVGFSAIVTSVLFNMPRHPKKQMDDSTPDII